MATSAIIREVILWRRPAFRPRIRLPDLIDRIPLCGENRVNALLHLIDVTLCITPGANRKHNVVRCKRTRRILTGELNHAHIGALLKISENGLLTLFHVLKCQCVRGFDMIAGKVTMTVFAVIQPDVLRLFSGNSRVLLGRCSRAIILRRSSIGAVILCANGLHRKAHRKTKRDQA